MTHVFTRGLATSAFALAVAAGSVFGGASDAEAQTTLRLSHQWSTSDIRHEVAQILADEVAAADVGLDIRIYPSASLFGATEQWQPLTRGQLDMTVFPLSYAGGRHPEFNLTLMPGLVKNHDHSQRIDDSEFMDRIEGIAEEEGVKILVHGWLAGGFGTTGECITRPEHVEGVQMRSAGSAFEEMLAAAGASITSMPSSEIYSAVQSGVLDAVNTSSSSFVSYRLYEQFECYTPAADYALWFMYQPVLMSSRSYDSLNDEQKAALEAAVEKAQAYYYEEAPKEDSNSIPPFEQAGVEVAYMTAEDFAAWRELAQRSSYVSFTDQVEGGQELLDMALSVE